MIARIAISLIFFLCSSASIAGIAVEPALVKLKINQGRASGHFVITNTGGTEERYRILASFFTYTEDGQVQLIEPDKHSMASWIKFNPKEFSLPPNSKRVVRYVVLPRGKIEDGEYWAAMELESLEGRNYATTDNDGRTFNLKVTPSILAPLYGRTGKIDFAIDIETFELSSSDRNKQVLELKASNPGTGILRLRGAYEVLGTDGAMLSEGMLDSGLLLPGRTRKYVSYVDSDLDPGSYVLRVNYTAPGIDTIEQEFPFNIDFVKR